MLGFVGLLTLTEWSTVFWTAFTQVLKDVLSASSSILAHILVTRCIHCTANQKQVMHEDMQKVIAELDMYYIHYTVRVESYRMHARGPSTDMYAFVQWCVYLVGCMWSHCIHWDTGRCH